MIALTEEQRRAVQEHLDQPLPMVAPVTNQTFMLVRRDLYERLTEYDDSPWTDEEMDLLAAEVDAMLADDMAIEDAEDGIVSKVWFWTAFSWTVVPRPFWPCPAQ